MSRILVTSYANPDLDGTAGAIAYAEFLNQTGQTATAASFGWPRREAQYMLERFGIGPLKHIESAEEFEEIVMVDASDLKGLEGKLPPAKVIEIIDHRAAHNAALFPRAAVQIELVGAAATLVAERFMKNGVDITGSAAVLLAGAIISNTLNFQATITTDRDRAAFAWLQARAALPDDFWRELFAAKSDYSGEKLAERFRDDFTWFTFGERKVGIVQIEMLGAKALIAERQKDILALSRGLMPDYGLDNVFVSFLELDGAYNIFVTDHAPTQRLLETVLGVRFADNRAERPGLMLRKQIAPLLKIELEKTPAL